MATEATPRPILRDPYYGQIVARLSGHIDPQLFERCVGDLLRRHVFPGLVPVTGGGDQGFDGAISDGRGEPYQLVCTTSGSFSEIRRNLIKSLRAASAKRWPRRLAVQVVSAALTPQQRAKLFETARSEGFTLIHLAERESLADVLYRDAKGCRDLLGLSGQPRALSTVPATLRPFATVDPVGRAQDLDWLRTTSGDRVLWGQPGSGKTLLLRVLAREGRGLFLASDDRAAVANELRESGKPIDVFVDDARFHPERLDLLLRLREEIGHDFSIVATCWPGDVDHVAERLRGIPKTRRRQLEPLSRDEIVEVYRRLNVSAPDSMMRVLVNQASNKPGLAATLAHAWLSGDETAVLTGEALCRRVVDALERRADADLTLLLAALALGGDGGMPLESASRHLQVPPLHLVRELDAVLHAGVLQQDRSQSLSVIPPDLRAALIRRRFFPTPGDAAKRVAVSWRTFLNEDGLCDAALELVRAARLGAEVPRSDLEDLLLRADEQSSWRTREAWGAYAALGRGEAGWVLDRYPRDVVDVARETLAHAPERTIERLLECARTAEGPLHNQPGHPLRILKDWIQRPPESQATELVERRSLAIAVARRFLERTSDRDVAIHAMMLALDPGIHWMTQDPGLGSRFALGFGFLPMPSIGGVARLWGTVRTCIDPIDSRTWWRLESVLQSWSHPETVAHGPVGDDLARVAKDFVVGVVNDLLPSARNRPGLSRALERVAGWVGMSLSLDRDATFELLFPERRSSRDDELAAREERAVALGKLAIDWSGRPVTEAAAEILRLSSEAAFVPGHEDLTRRLCVELAERVDRPEDWLRALVDASIGALQVEPFLARCVRERRHDWQGWLERCFDREELRWAALEQLLTMSPPVEPLVERAVATAGPFAQLIETLSSQRRIPLPQLRSLLRSEDAGVRLAAAAGEWNASSEHAIRPEISEEWRSAILRIDSAAVQSLRRGAMIEFWLGEILSHDTELATEWLCARLGNDDSGWLSEHGPAGEAIHALSPEQRAIVLGASSSRPWLGDLIRHLVGRDVVVYRRLLAMTHLETFHLAPLHGIPDDDWKTLASAALAAGYTPDEVARESLSPPHTIVSREEIAHWERFMETFAALAASGGPGLQQVGRAGVELTAKRIAKARANLRALEVSGF